MKPTTTQKFNAIQLAISKGFELNDQIDLEDNYHYALDHISNNLSSNELMEIEGEKHEGYIRYDLPLFGACQTDGEIYYNRDLTRWEEVAQDNDGKLYLIIAK